MGVFTLQVTAQITSASTENADFAGISAADGQVLAVPADVTTADPGDAAVFSALNSAVDGVDGQETVDYKGNPANKLTVGDFTYVQVEFLQESAGAEKPYLGWSVLSYNGTGSVVDVPDCIDGRDFSEYDEWTLMFDVFYTELEAGTLVVGIEPGAFAGVGQPIDSLALPMFYYLGAEGSFDNVNRVVSGDFIYEKTEFSLTSQKTVVAWNVSGYLGGEDYAYIPDSLNYYYGPGAFYGNALSYDKGAKHDGSDAGCPYCLEAVSGNLVVGIAPGAFRASGPGAAQSPGDASRIETLRLPTILKNVSAASFDGLDSLRDIDGSDQYSGTGEGFFCIDGVLYRQSDSARTATVFYVPSALENFYVYETDYDLRYADGVFGGRNINNFYLSGNFTRSEGLGNGVFANASIVQVYLGSTREGASPTGTTEGVPEALDSLTFDGLTVERFAYGGNGKYGLWTGEDSIYGSGASGLYENPASPDRFLIYAPLQMNFNALEELVNAEQVSSKAFVTESLLAEAAPFMAPDVLERRLFRFFNGIGKDDSTRYYQSFNSELTKDDEDAEEADTVDPEDEEEEGGPEGEANGVDPAYEREVDGSGGDAGSGLGTGDIGGGDSSTGTASAAQPAVVYYAGGGTSGGIVGEGVVGGDAGGSEVMGVYGGLVPSATAFGIEPGKSPASLVSSIESSSTLLAEGSSDYITILALLYAGAPADKEGIFESVFGVEYDEGAYGVNGDAAKNAVGALVDEVMGGPAAQAGSVQGVGYGIFTQSNVDAYIKALREFAGLVDPDDLSGYTLKFVLPEDPYKQETSVVLARAALKSSPPGGGSGTGTGGETGTGTGTGTGSGSGTGSETGTGTGGEASTGTGAASPSEADKTATPSEADKSGGGGTGSGSSSGLSSGTGSGTTGTSDADQGASGQQDDATGKIPPPPIAEDVAQDADTAQEVGGVSQGLSPKSSGSSVRAKNRSVAGEDSSATAGAAPGGGDGDGEGDAPAFDPWDIPQGSSLVQIGNPDGSGQRVYDAPRSSGTGLVRSSPPKTGDGQSWFANIMFLMSALAFCLLYSKRNKVELH
ncbi:MAG: hypothetical protein LBR77_11715 [Lachnospiraceae bacterium]|nr:hypothetical protein [Lachnospiraceae bacterium]